MVEPPEGRSLCKYRARMYCPNLTIVSIKVDTSVVFWRPEVSIDEAAPFQITAVAPDDLSLSGLPITAVRIQFDGDKWPTIVVGHVDKETEAPHVQSINLGQISTLSESTGSNQPEADLRWPIGATKVFFGTLVSNSAIVLRVGSVTLRVIPISGLCGEVSLPRGVE